MSNGPHLCPAGCGQLVSANKILCWKCMERLAAKSEAGELKDFPEIPKKYLTEEQTA